MKMKTNFLKLALAVGLLSTAWNASAQFGGVVFDPKNWVQNNSSALAAVKNEINTARALVQQVNSALALARSTASLKNLTSLAGVQDAKRIYTALRDIDTQLSSNLERNQAITQTLISQYGASNQTWEEFSTARSRIADDERRATMDRFRSVNASLEDTAQRRQQIVGQLASVQGQTEALQALGASLDVIIGQNQQIIMSMQANAVAEQNRVQGPQQQAAKGEAAMRAYQKVMRDAASKY